MSQLFANNAASTLASGITDVATSLTVAAGEGAKYPVIAGADYFLVTLFQFSGANEINHEIIKVTARTTDTFTITRAQEGTTARAFNAGDKVELRLTAASKPLTLVSEQATGLIITGGTTPKTLTVDDDLTTAQAARRNAANTFTGQQTFAETMDTVYTITDGAAFEIDPVNGNVQVVTLGANRTPAATNFAAGQTVLLGVDDGTAYALTWPTMTWIKSGGTGVAPTLATSGFTWVILWKQGSTLFGAIVGSP